jgi:hypothetical protein
VTWFSPGNSPVSARLIACPSKLVYKAPAPVAASSFAFFNFVSLIV